MVAKSIAKNLLFIHKWTDYIGHDDPVPGFVEVTFSSKS